MCVQLHNYANVIITSSLWRSCAHVSMLLGGARAGKGGRVHCQRGSDDHAVWLLLCLHCLYCTAHPGGVCVCVFVCVCFTKALANKRSPLSIVISLNLSLSHYRHTHRQTHTHTHRQTQTDRHTQTHTHTHRHTRTDTHTRTLAPLNPQPLSSTCICGCQFSDYFSYQVYALLIMPAVIALTWIKDFKTIAPTSIFANICMVYSCAVIFGVALCLCLCHCICLSVYLSVSLCHCIGLCV